MCLCNNDVFIFVILCCVSIASSYNVDTQHVIRHQGPLNSMFGFTVAAHLERGDNMVLVGAPKARTSQPGVRNGGAVFRCDTFRNDSCSQIDFDLSGDYNLNGRIIDNKTEQWFGSTLFSAGPNGPVVACASRYVWYSTKYDRRDPVGTCYIARNHFRDFSEYSPCRTSQWGYHRQGSCQAGFSAAISKDGRRLFVGAPGNCYWQGRTYSIDANAKFPYKPPTFRPYGSGQVIRQSLESRPAVIQTLEGSEADDDSYLGYSMAIGDFNGDGTEGVATGMPRGGGLLGKVLLYTWNLTNFMNITGRQMGCYFGYAVAAADIDGDKFDDIIIGAPLFTEPNNVGKYEVGKVYVVYQRSQQGMFRRLHELDGINSKSRFGLSLASLGDINIDGYMDFAVGAPYDGPDGRGAVYIFHGSEDGVIQKHTQVIYAEQVSNPPPSTFGFSLAGGVDLDRNTYPDTIVGAYLSDTAFFLRSRPVVKVDGYAQFQTVRTKKEIVLEDKRCHILVKGIRTPVACTTIDTCLKYTGVGVPREVSLQLQYVLDTQKKKDPRMFLLREGDVSPSNVWIETMTLFKDGESKCTRKVVYIKNDIRDKLTPLDVEVTYSMNTQYLGYSEPAPVLDVTSSSLRKDSISVHKNCGDDDVCIPDLVLDVKSNVDRYLLASNEVLVFDVNVSNEGEDSFETTFTVGMPEDVNYNRIQDTGDVRISCREGDGNYSITCDIGNPLPARKIANFKMFFKPHYKEGMKRFYTFNMVVNSTNPEDNRTLSNNEKLIQLPIWVNSRLELKGASRPSDVRYNYSYFADMDHVKHEREIGPQVVHLYTITNNGPSRINEAEILIFWPYATVGGEDLMYLLEPPYTLGNVRCEAAADNYRGYQVERRKKKIWEAFDIDVSSSAITGEQSTGVGTDGVILEEGKSKQGAASESLPKDDKNNHDKYGSNGDASHIHVERGQKGQVSYSDGKSILVTEGSHQGSSYKKTKTTSTNMTYGPEGNYTHTRTSTTITGPDGQILHNQTSSSGGATSDSFSNQFNQGYGTKHHSTRNQALSISGQHSESHMGSGLQGRINTDDGIYKPPYSSVEFDEIPPDTHTSNDHITGRLSGYEDGTSGQTYGSQYQGARYVPEGHNRQYPSGSYDRGQNYGTQSGQTRIIYGSSPNRTSEADYVQSGVRGSTLGGNAKVGVLELGILDRNVDQSLSKQSGSATYDEYNTQHGKYDPDLSRIGYGTPRPGGVYKSRTYSEGKSGQYGSDENRNYEQSGGSHQETYSHWSKSGGNNYNLNIGNSQDNQEASIHGRKRRQTNDEDLTKEVQCKATRCKFVRCFVGPMKKDQESIIALRTRINVNTLKNISSAHPVSFSTMMVGKITNVPYIGIPSEKETVKYEIVTNVVAPEPDKKPDVVPLWVVVLSAVAGALILLLLIFLFYKCGFFKRNRPSNAPERQPLNRNGHYSSGDEAL